MLEEAKTLAGRYAPTQSSVAGLDLVVIIPALNEQATIAEVIEGIPRVLPGVSSIRVLVVDDGSSDLTGAKAAACGAEVVRHGQPKGVGAAFQTGVARALEMGAELIVSLDGDGQFDPGTIPQLIAPVTADLADFTTASRFADPALTPAMPRIKRWGNRMMAGLISHLVRQEFHDVSCGMRCYNRRAALSLNTIGCFTYTQEVFLNLAFKRFRLVEVPIRIAGPRRFGQSRVARNVWRYAYQAMWIVLRCYRDYFPMRLFGKLAAGLIVLAVMLEGFLMVHYLRTGNFSPHKWAGFAGAALLGLGLMSLIMGIFGDMLNRHRIYLEEALWHLRNHAAGRKRHDPTSER
jgi:glycosyltransferase involved in cell wall biosynthesis